MNTKCGECKQTAIHGNIIKHLKNCSLDKPTLTEWLENEIIMAEKTIKSDLKLVDKQVVTTIINQDKHILNKIKSGEFRGL
jgi:hypothetical protein